MKRHCRPATIRVPKLSVRASLPDFRKSQLPKKRHDFAWLENRRLRQGLRHFDGLSADELALESGGAVLQEHLDYFLEVRTEFVECVALAVRTRKPRYPPHVHSGVGVSLNDRSEVLHADVLSMWNDIKTPFVIPAAERPPAHLRRCASAQPVVNDAELAGMCAMNRAVASSHTLHPFTTGCM